MNQSHNACVNYSNRNASKVIETDLSRERRNTDNKFGSSKKMLVNYYQLNHIVLKIRIKDFIN